MTPPYSGFRLLHFKQKFRRMDKEAAPRGCRLDFYSDRIQPLQPLHLPEQEPLSGQPMHSTPRFFAFQT